MAIIKKRVEREADVEYSSSKKVGKANSRELNKNTVRKKSTFSEGGGSIAQMNEDGKMLAPQTKTKKKSKSIFAMIKEAKKKKKK